MCSLHTDWGVCVLWYFRSVWPLCLVLFFCHFNTSPANLDFSGVSVLANLLRMNGSKSLLIIYSKIVYHLRLGWYCVSELVSVLTVERNGRG